MASSFEENLIVTNEKNNQVINNTISFKPKSKRMTKKRSKQIQMANELIFDLDIWSLASNRKQTYLFACVNCFSPRNTDNNRSEH